MTKDLADLNARFVWTKDGFDSYRFLEEPEGPLKGDCDDYGSEALLLAVGKSLWRFWWELITFQAVFWSVTGESWGSHVVVWRRGMGWIDNQNKAWGPRKHSRCYPIPVFMVAFKMLVGKLQR